MIRTVESVDIVFDVVAGDASKGKVAGHLASFKAASSGVLRTEKKHYDYSCRYNGGQNAGHTIFKDGVKYKTHIVPAGVFHGIKSVIGPGCVVNLDGLIEELNYLEADGFNTDLIKISPMAHIVTEEHIEFDKANLAGKLGTTSKGIAPAYAAKYARTGQRFESLIGQDELITFKVGHNTRCWSDYLFEGQLYGNILCEAAQGFYLDINWGNYPFVTSSETLPYAACSLGFSPKKIRNMYAVAKAYDTRSGTDDANYPDSLFDNPELDLIGQVGQEIGTTTGRRRKVNYMNLDRLIFALNTAGGNKLIISKCDILEQVGIFRLFYHGERRSFVSLDTMKEFITDRVMEECPEVERIYYSYSAETVEDLTVED